MESKESNELYRLLYVDDQGNDPIKTELSVSAIDRIVDWHNKEITSILDEIEEVNHLEYMGNPITVSEKINEIRKRFI